MLRKKTRVDEILIIDDVQKPTPNDVIQHTLGALDTIDESDEDISEAEVFKQSIEEEKPKQKPKADKPAKRGPGRPRKVPKKDPAPRQGIKHKPSSRDYFMEFLYDQPLIFKKIFQFFKSMASDKIQILYRKRDIIFFAKDHLKKSSIRVKIDAERLNHYYITDELNIGIQAKDLELLASKVDKDYSSVILLSDNSSTQKTLTIVFRNDIEIDETHEIELIANYDRMDAENERAFLDENYKIKFTLPGKYFRKTIADMKTMSDSLCIRQDDDKSPMIFEYVTANKKIRSTHAVKNGKKVHFESALEPGDTFRVMVRLDYIKPISGANIADEIELCVDEDKQMMVKAYLDDHTVEIKILTEIIDERIT